MRHSQCPECGWQADRPASYCPSCGSQLTGGRFTAPSVSGGEKTRPTPAGRLPGRWFAVLLLLMLGALAWLSYSATRQVNLFGRSTEEQLKRQLRGDLGPAGALGHSNHRGGGRTSEHKRGH